MPKADFEAQRAIKNSSGVLQHYPSILSNGNNNSRV